MKVRLPQGAPVDLPWPVAVTFHSHLQYGCCRNRRDIGCVEIRITAGAFDVQDAVFPIRHVLFQYALIQGAQFQRTGASRLPSRDGRVSNRLGQYAAKIRILDRNDRAYVVEVPRDQGVEFMNFFRHCLGQVALLADIISQIVELEGFAYGCAAGCRV